MTVLSIIMAVHDNERHLLDSLESMSGQSCQDFEIIAIDDASTDLSSEVLRDYASTEPRLKLFRHTEIKGMVEAWRTGLKNCVSESVIFLEPGDVFEGGALEGLAVHLKSMAGTRPDLLVFGATECLETEEVKRSCAPVAAAGLHEFQPGLVISSGVADKCFKTSLLTAELLDQHQGTDGQDFLPQYLARCRSVFFDPEPRLHHWIKVHPLADHLHPRSWVGRVEAPGTGRGGIKILIGYHKPARLMRSGIMTPIHLGRALKKSESKDGRISDEELQWLEAAMIGDDTGDNISGLNRIFAELTAQYWAYKNPGLLDNPEYIGFMHYRRHFMFNAANVNSDSFIQRFQRLNDSYLAKAGLSDQQIIEALDGYDGIVSRPHCLDQSVYQYFQGLRSSQWHLDTAILDTVMSVAEELFPDYAVAINKSLSGTEHFWFNMFVFRRSLFERYARWLFDILFEAEKRLDLSAYDLEGTRVLAHIAERLLGVFVTKLQDEGEVKLLELAVTYVENTDLPRLPAPFFKDRNIAIALSADDSEATSLAVFISSLLAHLNDAHNYDLIVFADHLSDLNRAALSGLAGGRENVCIRFLEIRDYISSEIKSAHDLLRPYRLEDGFCLYAGFVFEHYERVLCLNPTAIIAQDPARLYGVDFKGRAAGVCRDLWALWLLNTGDERFTPEYVQRTLGVEKVENYFQTGIMALDVTVFKKRNFWAKSFRAMKRIAQPFNSYQDILNTVLHDEALLVDQAWALQWELAAKRPASFSERVAGQYVRQLELACQSPGIIQYPANKQDIEERLISVSASYYGWLGNSFRREMEERLAVMTGHYEWLTGNLQQELQALTEQRESLERDMARLVTRVDRRLSQPKPAIVFQRAGLVFRLWHRLAPQAATCWLLKKSAAFDGAYYLSNNPDVLDKKLEPLRHYVKFGAAEGRRPNSWFDGRFYLEKYPDVASSGLNPLLHYILYGCCEARITEESGDYLIPRL